MDIYKTDTEPREIVLLDEIQNLSLTQQRGGRQSLQKGQNLLSRMQRSAGQLSDNEIMG